MQIDFADVKTTIREHPVETVAVVATVGLIGAFFYQRNQKKQLELAKYKAMQPSRWTRRVNRRHQTRYVLDFVA